MQPSKAAVHSSSSSLSVPGWSSPSGGEEDAIITGALKQDALALMHYLMTPQVSIDEAMMDRGVPTPAQQALIASMFSDIAVFQPFQDVPSQVEYGFGGSMGSLPQSLKYAVASSFLGSDSPDMARDPSSIQAQMRSKLSTLHNGSIAIIHDQEQAALRAQAARGNGSQWTAPVSSSASPAMPPGRGSGLAQVAPGASGPARGPTGQPAPPGPSSSVAPTSSSGPWSSSSPVNSSSFFAPGTGVIGGPDAYGCFAGAGYTYCPSLKKCMRPWEETCPDLPVVLQQPVLPPQPRTHHWGVPDLTVCGFGSMSLCTANPADLSKEQALFNWASQPVNTLLLNGTSSSFF